MSAQPLHVGTTSVIPVWTFADRLRKARTTAGMDQRTFAQHIDCTASAYAQWEAGNSRPRDIVSIAKRIEMLTRIPASWMLDIDAPTTPGATKKAPAANGEGLGKLPHLDSNQEPIG